MLKLRKKEDKPVLKPKKEKHSELKPQNPKVKRLKIIVSFIAIIIVLALIYFSGIIPSKCPTDECFQKAFSQCTPVSHLLLKNNNLYEYRIYRSLFSNCNFKITMQKSAPGTDLDIKTLLEGKSMKCSIPKSLTATTSLDNLDNMLDYCTGELKEGMYQVILNRMYGLIVLQMKDVVSEAKNALKQF